MQLYSDWYLGELLKLYEYSLLTQFKLLSWNLKKLVTWQGESSTRNSVSYGNKNYPNDVASTTSIARTFDAGKHMTNVVSNPRSVNSESRSVHEMLAEGKVEAFFRHTPAASQTVLHFADSILG
jgi:hypothetical protein